MFSDWSQLWFGVTNFTYARLCTLASVSSITAVCIAAKLYIAIPVLFCLFAFVFLAITNEEDAILTKRRTESMYKNLLYNTRPLVIVYSVIFDFWIVPYIPIDLNQKFKFIDLELWTTMTSFTLMVYFMSCTPKRRSKNKIKEYVEKMRKTPDLKPAVI